MTHVGAIGGFFGRAVLPGVAAAMDGSIGDLTPEMIERYLLANGWTRKPYPRQQLLVFEGPLDDHGSPIVETLPASREAADFLDRARDLVDALSAINRMPRGLVVHEILESAQSISGEASGATSTISGAVSKLAREARMVLGGRADEMEAVELLRRIDALETALQAQPNSPLSRWLRDLRRLVERV